MVDPAGRPGLLDLAGFALAIGLLLLVARRAASRSEEYLVVDRSLGLFPLVATLVMTEFNTSTLVAFSAAGYRAGPMAVALPMVFLIGLGFYTVTVARAWKRFNRLSVAELFSTRYSTTLGRVASVLLMVAMIGFSATYLTSLTLLVRPWTGPLDPWSVSAGLAVVTLAVLLRGGLAGVVRTDIAGVLLTLGLVGALYFMSRTGIETVPFPALQRTVDPIAQWNHPALPFRFVSTLIVLTCFTYIAAPWYGQKIFAARSERVAFLAVGIAAVLVFVLYGAVVLAAAAFRTRGGALTDPQLVVPAMVTAWLPDGIRGVGFGVLVIASLTTLSGVWSAMTAMVAADFGWARAGSLLVQRVLAVAIALVCWLGANLLGDDILDRLILANIPVAALAFALLAGFHWKRATTAGAWASVVVGVGWGVGCYLVIGEAGGYTWPWAIYGIPLTFAAGIAGSLISARR